MDSEADSAMPPKVKALPGAALMVMGGFVLTLMVLLVAPAVEHFWDSTPLLRRGSGHLLLVHVLGALVVGMTISGFTFTVVLLAEILRAVRATARPTVSAPPAGQRSPE